MMKAHSTTKGFRAALKEMSLAAPGKKRFRRTDMLVEGWSSACDLARHRCAVVVRRTDLEGGLINHERGSVVLSTAAEQFYDMTVSEECSPDCFDSQRTVTISNTRLYQTKHTYGFYCLEISTLPLAFFKNVNGEDIAHMSRADWAKCWKLSQHNYTLRITTDKEMHITEMPVSSE